jgi:hypothetical protein
MMVKQSKHTYTTSIKERRVLTRALFFTTELLPIASVLVGSTDSTGQHTRSSRVRKRSSGQRPTSKQGLGEFPHWPTLHSFPSPILA